ADLGSSVVPGGGATPGPPEGLTRPPAGWEGAPLHAVLARYADRLGQVSLPGVAALALATVDVERAAADVGRADPDGDISAAAFRPAPRDELLGARGIATTLSSARTLLLLEPDTEGPLAAFLARHGEGLAALYVIDGAVARRPVAARGRAGRTALGRSGRLVGGLQPGDPLIVLI
ncbi:MAG: hypothetical protein ACHQZR_09095, partial [Candidatus Limnocylindrales bacterium]